MKLKKCLAAAVSLGCLGLSGQLLAQDTEAEASMVLEEVVVTATRVETDLMKTPIAVTAFEQEYMDRAGISNVSDLANFVPNMDISTINGQSTPVISMRGVRSTNETELGDPAVGVHLDGVYSPRMQGILALMFDNERVEVLRGPQGTLFGRNSTVGTINIIAAKPDAEAFSARVNVAAGNYDAREVQGMVNIPITDNFAIRASGRWNERDSYLDGYYDPNQYDQRLIRDLVADADVIATGSFDACTDERCYTRTQKENWWIDWTGADNGWSGYDIRELVKANPGNFYNNTDEWGYRIGAQWEPTDDMSVYLSYQQYRNDSAGGIDLVNCEKLRGRPVRDADGNPTGALDDCSTMFPADDTYQAVVNVPGRLYLDIKYVRALFDWQINDSLLFKYLGGWENQDRESAQDMEQSLNAWDGSMFFLRGTGSKSYSHEIQLQSYGNERLNWIAGANYFHEKTTTLGYYDNTINDKAFWDQPDRSTDAWSVFGQATWSFADRWHLTLGYRHSDETKEDVGGRSYACTNDNGCAPGWYFRETLNALPEDAWWDPSIYPSYSENDNKGSWSHDDYRVGLDFDLSDNTLIYTYLASGFKAGGIGDVFSETNPRTGEEINVRTSFGPEEVLTWELGAKTTMLDGSLRLAATYFYTDYDDMQYASVGQIASTDRWQALQDDDGRPILDDNGQPVFGWVSAPIIAYYTQNVPGAEIQGIEVEFDWIPYENGHIWGYVTWLDTEITEDWNTKWNYDAVSYFGITYEESIDPENEILAVNLKGNELAVSPQFKLNLNWDHKFEFDAGTLVPWVNFHWEDDSYLTLWNVDKHYDDLDFAILDEDLKYTWDTRDSFWTMNATLRFYRNNWYVEAYGYNLTDEVVQYWGGAAERVAKGSFSTPRTYGLRFNYDFY
jgi:iron complex outermembrane receptor protein